MSKLLTPTEVADRLGISPDTLKRWRLNHEGPPAVFLSAQTVRYREEQLVAWLEERQLATTKGD